VTSLEDFCIWDLVLPLDVNYLSEESHMKLVELSDIAMKYRPGFTAKQQD